MEETKPKNNLKFIIGGIVALAAIVAVVLIVTNKPKDSEEDRGEEESSVVEGARVTAAELRGDVEAEIKFGDYEAMKTLAKEIQNGEATGKIITIDGVVSRPASTYSITEKNEDGSEKIGTAFAIDDDEADNYPEDGERIKITAKVVEIDTLYFQLVTLKEFVSKIDE